MRDDINGQSRRTCGDINLVSALMACGIPLDDDEPVSHIESDNGRYGTFRLLEISNDGKVTVERLMQVWDGRPPIKIEEGFAWICAFIKSRPKGIQKSNELLDYAVLYLQDRGIKLDGLRTMDDIPSYASALPYSEQSYVLSYVYNRETCFRLLNTSRPKAYMTHGEGRDIRRGLIDSRLPKWQTKELLSRLQG